MLEWLALKRIELAVWMYNRYVVEPYLKEKARQAETLAHLFSELDIPIERPTIH